MTKTACLLDTDNGSCSLKWPQSSAKMRKQRRIRKEDIGDPSNFVHVNHVGFGPKTSISTQQSFDMDPDNNESSSTTEESSSANVRRGSVDNEDELSEQHYPVERRNKGHRSRSSLIPRHHRSTTTCIFPPENTPYPASRGNKTSASLRHHHDSIPPSTPGSDGKSSLKPTFGSLLNLSFLPLGLGKSSSKSPSVGKAKRMSLLNLTASNLFANPKTNYEENRESVHMTSYTRRRSFSNSNDDIEDGETSSIKPVQVHNEMENSGQPQVVLNPPASKANGSTRIPLAKLGRSKSSMSEFTKRPKLRLKIPPPVPPPKPPRDTIKKRIEPDALPSPPPSPIPSPPPSPVPASPPYMPVALRKSPKNTPRPRIIPLPSASSHDSLDQEPSSPQFLTPAGGNSPLSTNETTFPLLMSPTIPPSSTPFFPTSSSTPGTPPVWPLQPTWPTSLPVQKEATIPEIPSPCQEEMETSENDSYDPVVSIVESFITCGEESLSEQNVDNTEDAQKMNGEGPRLAITSSNIDSISSVLRENIEYTHWPQLAHKLFQSIPKVPSNEDHVPTLVSSSTNDTDTYGCLLTKTLELWLEKAGDGADVEKLVTVLDEENHHQATESLRKVFGDLHM